MPSRSLLIALALRLVVAGVGIAAIAPAFGAGPAIPCLTGAGRALD